MPTKQQKPQSQKPEQKDDDLGAPDADVQPAEAAVAEAEEAADPGDEMLSFTYLERPYEFKRKRLSAIQFRGPMQSGRDYEAIEWLLGPAQFHVFLLSAADADGCTSRQSFLELLTEIGKAAGVPNS